MKRAAAILIAACLVILIAAVFACGFLAIWTHGSNASRWGGTAFLLFIVACAAVPLGGILALDLWDGAL